MRKHIIITVLIASSVVAVAVAQPKVLKHWQDVVMPPNQAWRQDYGSSDDSRLAYNILKSINGIKAQARALGLLKKEIDKLHAELELLRTKNVTIDDMADPNEVDPNGYKPQ